MEKIVPTDNSNYKALIDILDDDTKYVDYSFNEKQYVIIKKTKFMAVLDFIITMAELTIFGALAVGLLCIAL